MQAIRLKTEHLFDPVGVDFVAPPALLELQRRQETGRLSNRCRR